MIFKVFCCAAARAGNRKLAPTPAASAPVPVALTNSRRVIPRLFFFMGFSLARRFSADFSEVEELQLHDDVVRVLRRRRRRLEVRNDPLERGRDLHVLLSDVVIEPAHVTADVAEFVDRVLELQRLESDEGLKLEGLE